ncbi:MAG: bifunctional phosphoribosylaminoimidazolecarboxamide formyltransferase/IMP cyclohydrolase [Elusimicrobia bacterium]|nr:bifunctional phosphoribosylaminoimidazolecarboxamide formyltransferase/IMP cyclohydrolase [Elusimicrobiota bacterium]
MKRALISVSDKTGIVEFAHALTGLQFELVSTDGTAKMLRQGEIPVQTVEELTGFPEILQGRVKTLHPKIFGALLARRGDPNHERELAQLGIEPFDLVVVNLYPFERIVTEHHLVEEELVEYIDIGGVALLRAAAKNFQHVTAVCDPNDYPKVLEALQEEGQDGNTSLEFRRALAAKAFTHTARYDAVISAYFRERGKVRDPFPNELALGFKKAQDLRYGENPHQRAALYRETGARSLEWGVATAKQLQGKELSFNNLGDMEAAWQLVNEFSQPAAVVIKHHNPCGVAVAETLVEALRRALASDPVSAFGGVIGFNKEVNQETAQETLKMFFECLIAPGFRPEALEAFRSKEKLRLLQHPSHLTAPHELDIKRISGGILLQERDYPTLAEMKTVTKRAPTPEELISLDFAWRVAKHVTSNAIVLARGSGTLGIGAGQMSRIDALRVAVMKMSQQQQLILTVQLPLVMASDAFFPFRDCVDEAAKAGISAIIQPGGSIRDDETIKAANEYGLAMVFTGIRHFRH